MTRMMVVRKYTDIRDVLSEEIDNGVPLEFMTEARAVGYLMDTLREAIYAEAIRAMRYISLHDGDGWDGWGNIGDFTLPVRETPSLCSVLSSVLGYMGDGLLFSERKGRRDVRLFAPPLTQTIEWEVDKVLAGTSHSYVTHHFAAPSRPGIKHILMWERWAYGVVGKMEQHLRGLPWVQK